MSRYIDAEIAEKSLRQYADQKHANGEIELANGILKAVCKLKTIPNADVREVRRGKWMAEYEENNDRTMYKVYVKCSECGRRIYLGQSPWKYSSIYEFVNDYAYCHCGAKMEAE